METNSKQEVLGACRVIEESGKDRSGQGAELYLVSLGDSLRGFKRE